MEPLRTVSAGELVERHWRTMLAFYVGAFGIVSSLFAGSLWGWPLAAIGVPFAVVAHRAKGRLFEPEPGAESSRSAIALTALGLAVAFLVFVALARLLVLLAAA